MPLTAGDRVGPYEVIAPLGAGGMGEVYRAHDATLGRDVALKLLPRELADDPDRRGRMIREARAAASLNHPNICTIYEVGDAGGLYFIAMEVIDGESLSGRLAARPLNAGEYLRIGVELADAVAHAHDRGLIHRDLKSANVMITPEGRVKVLDFGLAKRVSQDALNEAAATRTVLPVTQPHTMLGTLPYMAPEQLRAEPADARSDIWSLGIVLYEMAAGSRPFDANTGVELSAAILREPPPLLPARVPASLRTVIGRCLEKEPARRYQRASEVRAALEAVRADPGAAIAPRRAPSVRQRWILATTVFSTIAVASAAIWWTGREGPPQPVDAPAPRLIRSIAVLPLENLSGNPDEDYFVAGIHEALITDLARIGLQKVIAKSSADTFKGTKKAPRDIGLELGVDGLVTGSVIRASNRIQITAQLVDADTGAIVWANRYERNTGDVLTLQNDVVGAIAREVRATLTPEQSARLATARQVNAAAHDAYLKGRSSFAAATGAAFDLERFARPIAQFEQAIDIDPTYAPAYAALSLTYVTVSQGSLLPPKETFPKARAAALKAVQLDEGLPDGHAVLGDAMTWYDWDWAGAEREIQRALELNRDSIDGLRASQTFLTLVAGRPDEAREVSQRILTLDPLNPFSRVHTIWVSFYSRRHDESIRQAQSLRDVWPRHIMAPFFLSANYAAKRMAAEVDAECGKVMDLLAGAYAIKPIGQCAWAHAAVGQTRQARRLLQILERPPAGVWLDPAVMAAVYGELGDTDRAIEWSRKGIDERSPLMIYMKAGAPWDRLRADPRFQAMLREMNFPP
jgi:eukaryotic-like serine/threonine-protein kinase